MNPRQPSARWTASQRRAQTVLRRLARRYPDRLPRPRKRPPFATLVGVILSARCTGDRVAAVLPAVLDRHPDAAHLARARRASLESLIRPCGLQHAKSRSLMALGRALLAEHHGRVPRSREALEALPGVGRKSASFVLANAFGQHALTVDTHVTRLAFRLGFCTHRDPLSAERALTARVAPRHWNALHFLLIAHGQSICTSRRPRCGDCLLEHLCPRQGVCR